MATTEVHGMNGYLGNGLAGNLSGNHVVSTPGHVGGGLLIFYTEGIIIEVMPNQPSCYNHHLVTNSLKVTEA